MPGWRSSSLSHQCPQCCTGPVPPSLSQPTGGGSIAAAFETAASSGVRAYARLPEACPSSIPPRLPAEGRPACPAIPRGRRPGRPSSGCSKAAYEMGRIACGIYPLPRSAAAFETQCIVSLRAASGMVSRGLVTTSITTSRPALGAHAAPSGLAAGRSVVTLQTTMQSSTVWWDDARPVACGGAASVIVTRRKQ